MSKYKTERHTLLLQMHLLFNCITVPYVSASYIFISHCISKEDCDCVMYCILPTYEPSHGPQRDDCYPSTVHSTVC